MSPARIPEGSVFVARRSGENVALALLEAAEQIGADRNLSVRTVSGGYHVFEAVAEQYQANLPDEEEVEEDESEEDETTPTKTVEEEEAEAEAKRLADEAEAAAKAKAEAEAAAKPVEITVTVDNTRDEINKFASELTPPVDTTKAATKGDAIKLIEDAVKPQTPAE